MRAVLIQTWCHHAPDSMRKKKGCKDHLVCFVGDLSKTAVLHFSGLVIVLKVNVSFLCCPSNIACRKNYGVEEQLKDNFKLICNKKMHFQLRKNFKRKLCFL